MTWPTRKPRTFSFPCLTCSACSANFSSIFSCKLENDILAEIFFLISNLYSSQEDFDMSNFYLNISDYLNPKFKFNLSLAAENYYSMNKYTQVKKVLKEFNDKDSLNILNKEHTATIYKPEPYYYNPYVI